MDYNKLTLTLSFFVYSPMFFSVFIVHCLFIYLVLFILFFHVSACLFHVSHVSSFVSFVYSCFVFSIFLFYLSFVRDVVLAFVLHLLNNSCFFFFPFFLFVFSILYVVLVLYVVCCILYYAF